MTCDDLACLVEVSFQGFEGLGEIVRLGLGSCCWVVVIVVAAGEHGGCGRVVLVQVVREKGVLDRSSSGSG